MRGTFFLPSGFMNQTNYMTTAQAQALQAAGHEIGGHSVTHADLAAVGPDELARQVCNDRATLMGYGLDIQSFAYPFASVKPGCRNCCRNVRLQQRPRLGRHPQQSCGFGDLPVC